jgi:hypothetical protein
MPSAHLPVINSCAPPSTRQECAGISRPCNRYSCRYHLWPDNERRGRPHHGVAPDPKLQRTPESCALDVVDAVGDSMDYRDLAAIIGHGLTAERVRQMEARAQRKLQAALLLIEWHERACELFSDSEIDLQVGYPPNNDTGSVIVEYRMSSPRGIDWRAPQQGLVDWLVVQEPALPNWVTDVFVYPAGAKAVRVMVMVDRPESTNRPAPTAKQRSVNPAQLLLF